MMTMVIGCGGHVGILVVLVLHQCQRRIEAAVRP